MRDHSTSPKMFGRVSIRARELKSDWQEVQVEMLAREKVD
jgi:hypothetical protein